LSPQFTGDSPNRFLVQFQTISSQLGARLLDRQLTDQAAHFGLDVGARSLADPIGRQFRVEPASLDASSLAATSPRRAVQRHHRDHQAPQKPDHQGASFFFNRTQRDFSLGSHFVDVLGHLGVFAGLGQQPGDVQIGLPPCLVVNFPFDGGKACWINHQAIQPLRLAFGQQPSRLVRDGGWRGCRRAVGTLTLSSSLFLVPAHLLFRLQKHFHNGLFPSCQSPVLFGLRPFA
jgi:hypothetical protein